MIRIAILSSLLLILSFTLIAICFRSPLRIQIASDLHIEFYGNNPLPKDIIVPQAPILALIGDVGAACSSNLKEFLHQQADQFETVLFLAGNHEYYNPRNQQSPATVEEQQECLRSVCSERENIHFMEKDAIEIAGVRILGTTLWSAIPKTSQEEANRRMNDYNLSFLQTDGNDGYRELNARDTVDWHKDSVAWLEGEIAAASTRHQTVVVLTHHTPSMTGTSAPQYDGSELSYCFSTDLTRLMQPHVAAWCSGHTHHNYDFYIGTTRLYSNQRGYPGRQSKGWDPNGVLEIGSWQVLYFRLFAVCALAIMYLTYFIKYTQRVRHGQGVCSWRSV